MRVNTKNGKSIGTTLTAQTEIPLRQDFAYTAGLVIKTTQMASNNKIIILFDFSLTFIYNYIKLKPTKEGVHMQILKKIKSKAKKVNSTIILPEANLDDRVYSACKIILKEKLSDIIVFGKVGEFDRDFKTPHCQIVDISASKNLEIYANQLYELRKEKGLTKVEATELVKNPAYFACMMLKNKLASGMVAGAKWSTGDTMRPALQIIKTKKGKKLVTGSMLLIKEGQKPLVFGDCALVQNPTAEDLSEIAVSNAELFEELFSKKPNVAMLSFSTLGSAKGDMVEKVKEATTLAKKAGLAVDGEVQFDVAVDEKTAKKKGLNSASAGKTDVFIFPDLNAGNIGYKIASRLGGYTAVGPIMLNFNAPVNDLSRGCTVEEIVNTVCVTKLLK
ncbi:MAG: phosphate acetyltransferase [Clostridia bacterium]|nr:phosphate acetyltransferase [Clostridia bacterium]